MARSDHKKKRGSLAREIVKEIISKLPPDKFDYDVIRIAWKLDETKFTLILDNVQDDMVYSKIVDLVDPSSLDELECWINAMFDNWT